MNTGDGICTKRYIFNKTHTYVGMLIVKPAKICFDRSIDCTRPQKSNQIKILALVCQLATWIVIGEMSIGWKFLFTVIYNFEIYVLCRKKS